MTQLAGKVAIVTGAASGIGRGSALALAARGAHVVCADRDGAGAAAAARECATDAIGLAVDVTSAADLDAMVAAALDRFDHVDAVLANAAVMGFGAVLETSEEDWDRVLGVDLRGVFLTARACLPALIESGGTFIATGSDCAIRTCASSAAYTTAKTGLVGLVRSIAVDYGADGVRANVIVPGVTDTAGVREIYGEGAEESIAKAAALSPLGRVGRPADLGGVVAFLCSDDARFITGATLVVDGGMTITYGAD